MNIVDRGAVRSYFMGKSQIMPIILMIVGIPLIFCMGIGIILIIIGAVMYFKNKNDFANEDKVDEVTKLEIENAKDRALKKFNLLQEQVSIIDPISISGPADQPNSPTAALLARQSNSILSNKTLKKALGDKNDDPIYVAKIGSDSKLRYTLVNITTYLFGESQLYIYYSNVDITTGKVFSEGTNEYFYKDIEAISTSQDTRKIFNIKEKKYDKVVYERVAIYTAACYYSASLGARKEDAPSKLETQITAMRNLIRDKKMA